jgi:hypothetical protein
MQRSSSGATWWGLPSSDQPSSVSIASLLASGKASSRYCWKLTRSGPEPAGASWIAVWSCRQVALYCQQALGMGPWGLNMAQQATSREQ